MDLLDKLGGKSETVKSNVNASASGVADPSRGDDLISRASVTAPAASASAETKVEAQANPASAADPATGSATVSNPSDWTLDNALKEIKKLREENKTSRIKYEESIERLNKEVDTKVASIEERYKASVDAAKELEEVKAKEADKKRDITEKLAHREALLAETTAKMDALKQMHDKEMAALRAKAEAYEAQKQAEAEVYKKRVDEELATIPQKFRTHAELLAKGAGDHRDALLVLQEAKLGGLFEDKTVVVNHSVPGARDGARVTNEQIQSKAREELDKMNSSQKIATALKAIRSGEKNSVFGNTKK